MDVELGQIGLLSAVADAGFVPRITWSCAAPRAALLARSHPKQPRYGSACPGRPPGTLTGPWRRHPAQPFGILGCHLTVRACSPRGAGQRTWRTTSRAMRAVSLGVLPTRTPTFSSASFLARALAAEPETSAPAWPMVLPSRAPNR